MDVCFDVRPDVLRIARKLAGAAASAAGAPDQTAFELEVAMGEALSNAYIHAYGERPRGQIRMQLALEDTRMTVTIIDNGRGLRRQPQIPSAISLSNVRGRGLYLMSHLMDDVKVIHPFRGRRGTAIRMKKQLVQEKSANREHGRWLS